MTSEVDILKKEVKGLRSALNEVLNRNGELQDEVTGLKEENSKLKKDLAAKNKENPAKGEKKGKLTDEDFDKTGKYNDRDHSWNNTPDGFSEWIKNKGGKTIHPRGFPEAHAHYLSNGEDDKEEAKFAHVNDSISIRREYYWKNKEHDSFGVQENDSFTNLQECVRKNKERNSQLPKKNSKKNS